MSFLGQAILNSKSVCSQIFVYSLDKKIDSFHSKLSETLMYLSKVCHFFRAKAWTSFCLQMNFPRQSKLDNISSNYIYWIRSILQGGWV